MALLILAACGPVSAPPRAPGWHALVDPQAWQIQPADLDPLAAHRPTLDECTAAAWHIVEEATEVQTRDCPYLSLTQPLVEPIERGDVLRVTVGWGDLRSPAPAWGHIAVLAGSVIVAERHVPIPSDSEVHTLTSVSERAFEAGTPIVLHVHNHGANIWQLVDFASRR